MLLRSCRACSRPAFRTLLARPVLARSYAVKATNPEAQLAFDLAEVIKTNGPLTLANYMRQCLTNPEHGYYSKQNPFGKEGDFVTSPEISQMFGELVGVHLLTEWMSLGKPAKVSIVELGPGKGTLLDDALRATSKFKGFNTAVQEVHLIEASDRLREVQRQKLCGHEQFKDATEGSGTIIRAKSKYGPTVSWHYDLASVPRSMPTPMVVAHEFFDALPIHAFEQTKNGWRELLVDVKQFSVILPSTAPTSPPSGVPPQFHLTLANRATLHSSAMLQSPRYAGLVPPARVEISPETLSVSRQLLELITQDGDSAGGGGSILIVDYGPADIIPIDTLRGIRKHKIVSPFEKPGSADLSVDVDFDGIKREVLSAAAEKAAGGNSDVVVHGPVTQSQWLHAMGIGARATVLAKAAKTDEARDRVAKAYDRLTDQTVGMGKSYKVMAITKPAKGGAAWVPAGFQTAASSS